MLMAPSQGPILWQLILCKQLTNRGASGGGALAKYGPGHMDREGAWLNSVEGSLFYEMNKASVDHAVGSKSYDARINTLGQRWAN